MAGFDEIMLAEVADELEEKGVSVRSTMASDRDVELLYQEMIRRGVMHGVDRQD